MENALNTKGQRPRLTCTECYRRKIKCDKNIPCSTCVKRGYAAYCTREEDDTSTAANEGQLTAINGNVFQTLLDRINQLQAQICSQSEDVQAGDSAVMHRPPPHTPCLSIQEEQNPSTRHASEIPQEDDTTTPHGPPTSSMHDDEDAATVLEFLAWGRSKDTEYGMASQHSDRLLLREEDRDSVPDAMFERGRHATMDLLETLLPDPNQIRGLINYHNDYLLWYHGSYSSLIFEEDLNRFIISFHGDLHHSKLDAQWLALLFAILTGSLACAPPVVRQSMGFADTESLTLARRWYEASVTCLNAGHYIERHTIYAVEAIATLTISAHILGRSSSQSVLLSSAGRIAQSLGLHRLNADEQLCIHQLRKREAGRRVFNQLCTQDWFQIPFSESYALNPRFITTTKPSNCNDADHEIRPDSIPTQASYCNYRYEIAALMPQLLDASSSCNTPFTKYEQVLKYDEKMRRLATESMPEFLSTSAAIAPAWPVWIRWARRSLAICAAHKIIMIHRKFLGLSFTNSAFSFTRRTCVAAAKTILREALSDNDQNGPVLWIEQAFSVAAGIVLSLDVANRSLTQDELGQHVTMMNNTVKYLESFEGSKIASRGAHLLLNLQKEISRGAFRGLGKRQRGPEIAESSRPSKTIRTLSSNQGASLEAHPYGTVTNTTERFDGGPEDSNWNTSALPFTIDVSLGPQALFDDLLSFQF